MPKGLDCRQFVEELKLVTSTETDVALERALGISGGRANQIRNGRAVGARGIRTVLNGVAEHRMQTAVKQIVEFFPVKRTTSARRARFEIFGRGESPRHKQLHGLLSSKAGVYLFYNSVGELIYVGKTKRNLWSEIHNAYNREMSHHAIYKVTYPRKNKLGSVSERRKLREEHVYLHETAAFLSAFEVDPLLTGLLEGFLIRATPNNVLNVRMENQNSVYW